MNSPPASDDDPRTHFAWLRTGMSAERTLEAWIRTAISLIGFGFTIVQVFARIDTIANVHVAYPWLPRCVGLAMIGIGVFALAISIRQYTILVNYLNSQPYEKHRRRQRHAGRTRVPIRCDLPLFRRHFRPARHHHPLTLIALE